METLNIGFIGAGQNTRTRHLPGFRELEGVHLHSVANRSVASAKKVAKEWDIPKVASSWMDIIDDPEVDAVCIGTWPYMHESITVAALESGKHVLCEARMASTLEEAHSMVQCHQQHPELVAQLVPSPFTLEYDQQINDLLADGKLGDLVSVDICHESPAGELLTWREQTCYSGQNTLALGIWYEALLRWATPAKNVAAHTKLHDPYKKAADGSRAIADVPDHIELSGELLQGTTYHMRFSSAVGIPRIEFHLTGTAGRLSFSSNELKHVDADHCVHILSPNSQRGWQVEKEFIQSIRHREPVLRTDFHDGLRYMAFTEAALMSAKQGKVHPVQA